MEPAPGWWSFKKKKKKKKKRYHAMGHQNSSWPLTCYHRFQNKELKGLSPENALEYVRNKLINNQI